MLMTFYKVNESFNRRHVKKNAEKFYIVLNEKVLLVSSECLIINDNHQHRVCFRVATFRAFRFCRTFFFYCSSVSFIHFCFCGRFIAITGALLGVTNVIYGIGLLHLKGFCMCLKVEPDRYGFFRLIPIPIF